MYVSPKMSPFVLEICSAGLKHVLSTYKMIMSTLLIVCTTVPFKQTRYIFQFYWLCQLLQRKNIYINNTYSCDVSKYIGMKGKVIFSDI